MEINLLGPIGARHDGAPVYLGPVKQREILAILALRRRSPISVEQLAADLWGEQPPDSATNLVHTYVGRLRRLLPATAPLRSRCPGYQLAVGGDQLDVVAFEQRLTQARTALTADRLDIAQIALTRALSLWTGPRALDGATGPLATAERARLAELRLDAVEDLLAVRLARGDCAEAVAELRSLVVQHPLRERLWALLLVGLARAFRRAEALTAFQQLRRVLADQLGVDPSPELMRIHDALLHGVQPVLGWLDHAGGRSVTRLA